MGHPEYRKLIELKRTEKEENSRLRSDMAYRYNFLADLKRSREKIVRFFS